MRIGIDCRLWGQSGVGRYIRNLAINLLELDEKNEYVLFVRSEDENAIREQIAEIEKPHFAKASRGKQKLKIVPVNIPWHGISEQLLFPRVITKQKLDLMHFPYFSVPIFYRKPFIVTIHDLILHHFVSGEASTLPYWLYGFKMLAYRLVINNVARKAKKIIAVSNATREEIFDHLAINKNKVEVVYEAADDLKGNAGKVEFSDYFLFVGNVYPHKDVDTLIKAFKIVAKKRDIKLVFAGKEDFFYKKMKKKIKDLIESGRVIFIDNADDEILASLYKNAICLIRPSRMEGFSLPPLEAISNECLVIASDIPVHREIFEDSILYFSPREYMDLADKMEYVLTLDKKSKDQMIARGLNKSKEFSWKLTAEQTLKVYESAINQ